MLIAFFEIDGLVHHEYVPRGQTVNKELYKTVLQRLRDAVHKHRPENWHSGNWILLWLEWLSGTSASGG